MDNACAGAVITDRNTDPRIFIEEDFHEDIMNDHHKAYFRVIKRLDGNWEVNSINNDPNTNLLARVPKEWGGLRGDDLGMKITDHLVVCRYGQLGFLEEKLPSDFRELPNHRFGLLDDDYVKMQIKDAIECKQTLLSVLVGSKKTAITVASVAADYLMIHNENSREE